MTCCLQLDGDFHLVAPSHEQLFAYTRSHNGARALVLMNFGTTELALGSLISEFADFRLALSNYADADPSQPAQTLRGLEGYVYIDAAASA